MLTHEEIANIFIQTMQAHADARPYDWAMYYVGLGGIIASLVVAYYAYQLNKQQYETLQQQNRIALFKERFKVYKWYKQLYKNIVEEVPKLEVKKFGKTMDRKNFIKAFFSKLEESTDKAILSKNFSTIEVKKQFLALEEKLDTIEYLFVLDIESETMLIKLKVELKLFKSFVISTESDQNYTENLNKVVEIISEKHLKDTMKKQLYILKHYK